MGFWKRITSKLRKPKQGTQIEFLVEQDGSIWRVIERASEQVCCSGEVVGELEVTYSERIDPPDGHFS